MTINLLPGISASLPFLTWPTTSAANAAATRNAPPDHAHEAATLKRSDKNAQRRRLAENAEPDKAAVLNVLKKILRAKELPKTPTATRLKERMKRTLPSPLQKAFNVKKKETRSTLLDEISMDLLIAFTSPYYKEVLLQKGKITSDMSDTEVEKKIRRWVGGQWRKSGVLEFGQKLPGVGVANGALAGSQSLTPVELFVIREVLATLLTFEANLYTRVTGVVINEAGRPRLPADLAKAATFLEIRDSFLKIAEDLLPESRELKRALQSCTGSSLSEEQTTALRQGQSVLKEKRQAFFDVQKQHAITRKIYDRLDKPTASVLGAIVNIVLPASISLSNTSGMGLKLLPLLLSFQAVASTMDFTRMQRNTLRFIGEHHDFSSLIKEGSRGKSWEELELEDLDDAKLKASIPVTFQPLEIKKLMDEVCSAAWHNLEAKKRKLIERHAQPYLDALRATKLEKEQQRNAVADTMTASPHAEEREIEIDGAGTLAVLDEEIRELQTSIALCEQKAWMTLYASRLDVELSAYKPDVKAGKQAVRDIIADENEASNPLAKAIRKDPAFQRLEAGMKNLEAAIALHAEGTPQAYRTLLTQDSTASTVVAKAWKNSFRLVLETERARRHHKIGEIPAMFLKTLGARYHPAGQGTQTLLMALCNHFGGHHYMQEGLHSLQGTGPRDGEAEAMFVTTLTHILLVSAVGVYGRKDASYTQDYILRLKMGVPDLFHQGGAFLKNVEALLKDGGTPEVVTDGKFLEDARKLLQDAAEKGVLTKKQKEVLDQAFNHLHRHTQSSSNKDAPASARSEQEQQHVDALMTTLRDFVQHWGVRADKEWANKTIKSENGKTIQIAGKTSGVRYAQEVPLKKRLLRLPQGLPIALFSIPANHLQMLRADKARKLAQNEVDKASALIKQTDRLLSRAIGRLESLDFSEDPRLFPRDESENVILEDVSESMSDGDPIKATTE